MQISYTVLVSSAVASNHAGNTTVLGKVRTVAVLPLVKRTMHVPVEGGVMESVATSPHT